MALAAVYHAALAVGTEATVWYKPALHVGPPPPVLVPLYFLNPRKQLFCFRNCAMVAYAPLVAAALAACPVHAAYVYAGKDGDTYALHLEPGIDEATEHRQKYDYSGAAMRAGVQMPVAGARAAILHALAALDSRRAYTSVLFRAARPWGLDQGLAIVTSMGAAALASLSGHVLVCTAMGKTQLVTLPTLVPAGAQAGPFTDGWRPMVVHPMHQRFLHPAAAVKTISSSGDCLYSALAYACAHMATSRADLPVDSHAMRLQVSMGMTPHFLRDHYCGGDGATLRTWLTDGSVFESGVVDREADAALVGRTRGKSAAEVYMAILEYKCSNAYWGRDFDVQMFERLTGIGVLVFASPAYFGDTVDILGRKPNGPYAHYVLLYNEGNVHFQAARVPMEDGSAALICGCAAEDLPPWLAYIVRQSLCV